MVDPHLTRRSFMKRAGLASAGTVMIANQALPAGAVGPVDLWCDLTRASLGLAAVTGTVSGEASYPDGFTVAAGDVFEFDPNRSTTVRVSGNVIVQGTLRMRPASRSVQHVLIFEDVDESAFVGGGMVPLTTDTGLWVTGSGVLDIQGSTVTAWNRSGDDGTWQSSDELVLTPTAFGDFDGFRSFDKGGTVPEIANPYGGAGAGSSRKFVDTGTSVHAADIDALADAGITKGCNPPDNTLYCPKDPVTRGQMAAFLARAMGLASAPSAGFRDTVGHLFEADIDKIADRGITLGSNPPENDLFSPDDHVTRGQMAAFLVRARELPAAPSAGFVDTAGSVFEDDIDRLAAAGITKGCNPPDNDRYCPNDLVTREQMASFLVRAFDLEVLPVSTAYRAEVLNLTRNVRIEGTSGGRTHIFVISSKPQTIKYAAFRHVGPRGFGEEGPDFATGRYGLHFHMCEGGSRGSVVEGVVVRDCGNHAFVPHLSDGITFRDCISYATVEHAFWWDAGKDNDSNDIVWERCVAAKVSSSGNHHRLAGFSLQAGEGNALIDSVAVGVLGLTDSAGVQWPEFSAGTVWEFHGNVSHNNKRSGIFTWQNDRSDHENFEFTCYHNGAYGINHGAYQNVYHYRDAVLYGNGAGALVLKAVNNMNEPDLDLRFTRVVMDGAGRSEHLVENGDHDSTGDIDIPPPTVFRDCVMVGSTGAKALVQNITPNIENQPSDHKDRWDFIDCGIQPSEVDFTSDADPEALVRIQNGNDAWSIDKTGSRSISPFD